MIIPSFESGQIVENGKLKSRQYNTLDTDRLEYCFRHSLTLTSDWKNPSPKDQKRLDKIKLKEYVFNDKGKLKKARFCPKCLNTVFYTRQP